MTEHPHLTLDEVRHLSMLSRVGATEEELAQMSTQLTSILDHIAVLGEADTTDVEPTGHASDVSNVLRKDVSRPSLSRGEALSNAPIAQEGYVRVRGVLDDGEA